MGHSTRKLLWSQLINAMKKKGEGANKKWELLQLKKKKKKNKNNNMQMQCMVLNLISLQTFWRQLEKLKYTTY